MDAVFHDVYEQILREVFRDQRMYRRGQKPEDKIKLPDQKSIDWCRDILADVAEAARTTLEGMSSDRNFREDGELVFLSTVFGMLLIPLVRAETVGVEVR